MVTLSPTENNEERLQIEIPGFSYTDMNRTGEFLPGFVTDVSLLSLMYHYFICPRLLKAEST